MYALADVENSGHTGVEHPEDPDGEDAVAGDTYTHTHTQRHMAMVSFSTSGVSLRLVVMETRTETVPRAP